MCWSQKFALQLPCPHHWGSAALVSWSQVSGIIWLWSWPKMWRRAVWSLSTLMACHLGLERYDKADKNSDCLLIDIIQFNLCIYKCVFFLHSLSDEVYPTVPWSLCLHGPHSCDWCVRADRNTSHVEGACSPGVAGGSCLPLWRGFKLWDRGCHIRARNSVRGQLPGPTQLWWVTWCMTKF